MWAPPSSSRWIRDAHQRADLLAVGGAQFADFGNQGGAEHRPDARGGPQHLVQIFEVIIGVDQLADLPVQQFDLQVQRLEHLVDGLAGHLAGRGQPAVALVGAGGDQLPAAGDQRIQFGLVCRAFLRQARFGQPGELAEHEGVDRIALGENVQTDRQMPDPAGIDHRHRQLSVNQQVHQKALKPSGGFNDDARGCNIPEQFDDLANAFFIIGNSEELAIVRPRQIEFVLGNINANENRGSRRDRRNIWRSNLRSNMCHASIPRGGAAYPALRIRVCQGAGLSAWQLSRLFG